MGGPGRKGNAPQDGTVVKRPGRTRRGPLSLNEPGRGYERNTRKEKRKRTGSRAHGGEADTERRGNEQPDTEGRSGLSVGAIEGDKKQKENV